MYISMKEEIKKWMNVFSLINYIGPRMLVYVYVLYMAVCLFLLAIVLSVNQRNHPNPNPNPNPSIYGFGLPLWYLQTLLSFFT